jgi:DNA-binding transcriptional LysR family regulator
MRQHIEEGRLVEVLPKQRAEPMPVNLLYVHRRHLPKRVQVFMSWVAQVLQSHLQMGN